MRGAGGTDGGTGTFLIGLAMMIAGGYGMILIPFIFGVGLVFYNSRNWIGWLLAIGSVIALVAGVIANLTLQFGRLNAFDLLVILVLLFGGVGLFLRSLRG